MTDRVDAKAVLDELLGHIKHLDGDPHVRGWYGAWMLSAANALSQTLADLEAAEKALLQEHADHTDTLKQLEAAGKHEIEFKWLLTHDSGDVGGVGRKRWLERKDALLAALAEEE